MHPRRTHRAAQQESECSTVAAVPAAAAACPRPPPSLVRQNDRKVTFVDSLVARSSGLEDSATQIVATIWPLSVVSACRRDSSLGGKGVLPLRTFIQETLRRSRTSYSTLQVALYYLVLIKSHVPKCDFTKEQTEDSQSNRALQCGRRMFLAALILASKYLQDRNYSARAWSKFSGLNTCEINVNEMTFLSAVNWRLHIPECIFQRWTEIVLKYTPSSNHSPPSPSSFPSPVCEQKNEWLRIIPLLTPELDAVDLGEEVIPMVKPGWHSPSDLAGMAPLSPVSSHGSYDSGYGSQENTPTPETIIPRVLEPNPQTCRPFSQALPPIPRLTALPTPQLTPQSTGANTPAVSVGSWCPSRRPSMCLAMAQAQNACLARSTMDSWGPLPTRPLSTTSTSQLNTEQGSPCARRSSLATSVSSSSSPASMVSDSSSRSSRSSSISSVSSLTCAPLPARLAVQATCRSAKLYQDGQKGDMKTIRAMPSSDSLGLGGDADLAASPESYIGPTGPMLDFSNLSLSTPRKTTSRDPFSLSNILNEPEEQTSTGATRKCCRKRRHGSEDQGLHQQVRSYLSSSSSTPTPTPRSSSNTMVLPDRTVASSFLLGQQPTDEEDSECKAVQSPTNRSTNKLPLPVCRDRARKRACCGTEAMRALEGRTAGPGMWEGIL